jgi:O-antigen/teichoic acid export membrane protein
MFIRDVFFTFSTEVLAVAINFCVGVLLARALSPAERGIMVLVMTFPWTVTSLVSIGLPQANIYLVGRKKRDAGMVLGNSLVAAAILSALSVVALGIVREPLLNTMLKGVPSRFWFSLMLLILAFLADAVTLSILRARQRFDLFNLRRVVTPVLLLVGFGIALLVSDGGLDVAVGSYVVVTVLLVTFSFVLTKREVAPKLTLNRRLAEDTLRFGLKSYVQNLVGKLNYRLDIYLLAFFLLPEQVALYGVATSIAEVAWYVPNSVGTVLFPRLSNAPEEEIHQITAKVCRNTLAGTAVIVAGLLAVGWIFVPLVYGSVYRASIPPLLILLPGVVSMAIYKVLTRNFTSRNRQQVPILASAVALLLNLGLDWVLIPRWGVAGAAIASTVGYTASGVVLLAFFLNESQVGWRDVLLPKLDELIGHWHWARISLQDRLVKNRDREETAESTQCAERQEV